MDPSAYAETLQPRGVGVRRRTEAGLGVWNNTSKSRNDFNGCKMRRMDVL